MIAGAILEAAVAEARARQVALHFVVLHSPDSLTHWGWRQQFMKKTLDRLDVASLDTRNDLVARARSDALPIEAYYLPDKHLNERGNRVVAESIVRWLGSIAGSAGEKP